MYFKIGEQYEKQEFNLQSINTILLGNLEYEVYRYIITPDETNIKDIRLYYNADILSAVHYQLGNTLNSDILSKIKGQITKGVIVYKNNHDLWIVNSVFNIEKLR